MTRPIVSIGAGAIVKYAHWPAYKLAGYQVHSVYDPNVLGAKDLANEFGVPIISESLEELIAGAPNNCIYDIATPAVKIESILETLPDGANVLVQKPLGENLDQAQNINAVCQSKKLALAVNFQLRYAPYAVVTRNLIDSGAIGNLHEIDVRVNVNTPWQLWDFLALAPRMEIVYHSIHYLDLIRSFLGEPSSVCARSIKHPASRNLHSCRSSVILDYGDWIRANIFTNHGHAFGKRHQESYIRFEGDKGCIKFQMGLNMNYPAGEPDYLEYISDGMEDWESVPLEGSWFPHAFIGTMKSVMRGADDPQYLVPTRLEDAMKTMALVEDCYQSSAR